MTHPWLAIIYFIPITLVCLGLGVRFCRLLRLDETAPDTSLHIAQALAIGYGCLAICVAIIGLCGLINPIILIILLVLCAIMAGRDLLTGFKLVQKILDQFTAALQSAPQFLTRAAVGIFIVILLCIMLFGTGVSGLEPLIICGVLLFVLCGFVVWKPRFGLAWCLIFWLVLTLFSTLSPPADSDWDGLAEHLAQAKVYAQTGQYAPLWYDHHSHFPSLVQMLFTLGMSFEGAGLAKLFHWTFGIISLLTLFSLGNRLQAGAGKWAVLLMAGTPMVTWLMQIGHVDLGTVAYSLLALYAFVRWLETRQTNTVISLGLFCGLVMSTKMQGLPVFGVMFAGLLVNGIWNKLDVKTQVIKPLALFSVIALLIAGPWYVKSWLNTGNPFYPFAYGIFGGKSWGPEEAQAYTYHQKEFGKNHLPPAEQYWKLSPLQRTFAGPRSPLNLLIAPIALTVDPVPFSVQWRLENKALLPIALTSWVGSFWLLGIVAFGFGMKRLKAQNPLAFTKSMWILGLFLPLWGWWLLSMQLDRYLLPYLILLAPLVMLGFEGLQGIIWRIVVGLLLAISLCLGTYGAATPFATSLNMLPQEVYLQMFCQVWPVSDAVNKNVPAEGNVALYGEPRGFYIDRPYLWADPGHHRLIPYDTIKTPEAMVQALKQLGVTHVLINQAYAGKYQPGKGSPVELLASAMEQKDKLPVYAQKAYVLIDIR